MYIHVVILFEIKIRKKAFVAVHSGEYCGPWASGYYWLEETVKIIYRTNSIEVEGSYCFDPFLRSITY